MTRALGLTLAALLLTGCGGGPSKDDAEDAAQEQAELFASGDYGGAWDMWTEDAQAQVSREDYVALNEECSETGIVPDVDEVRLEDDTTAVARLSIAGVAQSYTLRYEGDEWRWQPTDDTLATFEGGVDQAIERRKSEGRC